MPTMMLASSPICASVFMMRLASHPMTPPMMIATRKPMMCVLQFVERGLTSGSGLTVRRQALERKPSVTPCRSCRHRHRDEGGLRDLGLGGPGHRRLLRVGVDAPRALRDLCDAERDQLLGPGGDGAVLERLLIELEEGPVGLRRQLAHALELRLHVHAMEFH